MTGERMKLLAFKPARSKAPTTSRGFEKFWRSLSADKRAELEFRWKITRLWRRGPRALSEFLDLFQAAHGLRQPFEAAVDQYLNDDQPPPPLPAHRTAITAQPPKQRGSSGACRGVWCPWSDRGPTP
jgi:hypothetical protein